MSQITTETVTSISAGATKVKGVVDNHAAEGENHSGVRNGDPIAATFTDVLRDDLKVSLSAAVLQCSHWERFTIWV